MTLTPLLPPPALAALALLCVLTIALAAARRAPGWLWRALACLLLLLVLAGPERIERTGTPLPSIALLAVDHSASMQVADRAALAEAEAHRLTDPPPPPGLVLRRIDFSDTGTEGTRAFAAITAALADIPPAQRAGVIAITDGAITDAPPRFPLPLHVLIPAAGEQTDRRLRILTAPGYGIVGQSVTITLAVEDLGAQAGEPAHLRWSIDGAPAGEADATTTAASTGTPTGTPTGITVPITRAGPITLAIAAAARPGEASTLNNRVALTINGVRDRLRVLLISGEPHAGERTWRRLLKADPAVDLVHFTILRPPYKDDGTPVSQLALIAFPTRELFVDKIGQFDLIILDRFSDRGILPAAYLQNIADYVRAGGALLVAAGPEFANTGSIAHGPIGDILPALPDDTAPDAGIGAFRPAVTALGEHHPVTANLPGDVPGGTPRWGEWYRHLAVGPAHGDILLQAGPNGPPLLLLDHVDQGRVALLLSDQIWLWSRGHEGGGPQAELLRRVAHWLMKEPELDENALTAHIAHGRLGIERHSLREGAPPTATVIDPDGTQTTLPLTNQAGTDAASLPAATPGLWQVRSGGQSATAAAAPADPAEFADLRATATHLRPIATSLHWLATGDTPTLRQLALPTRHAMTLTEEHHSPLLPPWLALPLLLGAVLVAWWRESR